jgi:serine/threonine protein kinase
LHYNSVMAAHVDRYELASLLYADADVVAYHGHDPLLKRAVTVELLRPERAADPDAVSQLLDKARRAAMINLPHVAALYDQGSLDERPYLVLEEVAGPALREAAPLAPDLAMRVADSIAETIEAAQRDGQPIPTLSDETVRVSPDGHTQILDLGLRPPQQTTHAIGALGALLHLALGGATHGQRAAPLHDLAARAQQGRIDSIARFRAELRELRRRADTPTSVLETVPPTMPIHDEVPPPRNLETQAASDSPRRSIWPWLIAGVLLLSLIVGGMALWQDRSAPDATESPPTDAVPSPEASPDDSPADEPPPGGPLFTVATNNGQSLVVRSGPGRSFSRITSLRPGTTVEVLEGPQAADGFNWVRIRAGEVEGWCVREALREQ